MLKQFPELIFLFILAFFLYIIGASNSSLFLQIGERLLVGAADLLFIFDTHKGMEQ